MSRAGAGSGGADVSILERAQGLTLHGFGLQLTGENRLADDFTVPGPAAWTIETVTFYSYQTSSATISALTDLRLQIWDGPPEAASSRVVFGDRDTDHLISSTFSHAYRVGDGDLEATSRPILANVARVGVTLRPGTYWLDWSAAGASGTGPWSPPTALAGRGTPGNALQASSGEPFTAALDGALQVDFPFRVGATLAACDTPVVEVPVSFVVALLFLDGFESGSASNWSAVVP